MISRLKKLISYTDDECRKTLRKRLVEMGYTVYTDEDETYLFGTPKGNTVCPVLMCAHWDTIRQATGKWADEPVLIYEEHNKIENANGILGADDRAGCQLILEVASRLSAKPFVLFTAYEEVGMKGMHNFIDDGGVEDYLKYIYLILSVDRQGHNEAVYYSTYPSGALEYYMDKVGYTVRKSSSATDGMLLSPVLGLEHVNVSYGGYNPHNCDEFILIDSYVGNFWRLLEFVQLINKPYTLDISAPEVKPSENEGKGTAVLEPQEYSIPAPVCAVCGKAERIPKYSTSAKAWLCVPCLNRILKNSPSVSPEVVEQEKLRLKAEQARSREANLRQVKKNSNFPTCPVCGSNENVSWNAIIAGFTCNKCRHKWYNGQSSYDGVFWAMSENGALKKVYRNTKDTVLVISQIGPTEKVEWSGPIKKCTYLSVCSVCGSVEPVMHTVTMKFREQQRELQVCTTCVSELQSVGQVMGQPF